MQSLALSNESDLCKNLTKNRDACWLWIRRSIPHLSYPIGTQFACARRHFIFCGYFLGALR